MQHAVTGRYDLDAQFDALGHETRRCILLSLYRDRSSETEAVRITNDAMDASPVQLRHRHLPKLADYGYVELRDDDALVPGPNFSDLEPILETISEHWDDATV